jgi:hypothetical protein
MNSTVFRVGVGSTAAVSCCAVAYLTPSLRKILIDLCGTAERANFWTAFSNLSLILTPLIFALHQLPEGDPKTPLVLQLGAQIEWALIGLVANVLVVGFVISRFIPRPADIRVSPATGNAS